MLLAIDAGNTNTVFAVFEGEKLLGQWRMSTDANRTCDEYAVWLMDLMALKGIDPKQIDAAIIATVVPQALYALRTLTKQYFNSEAVLVSATTVNLDMMVRVERPEEVGADRLVNAFAARARYGNNLIILDFGTATTFDVVGARGDYLGGVIAPGINLSLEALHRAAAKLPNIEIARPAKVIGNSTISAMQSGVFYGYLGLIEGIISRIREELGVPMTVVATGGLASFYAKATPVIEHLDSDLTIYGLQQIYAFNYSQSDKEQNVHQLHAG
ncbi:MAG: type III pantothenate kinase [Alphaproteobacteria bacterium]|nr:type III pantothenate kinase [Alphaproteobacteria bacterium]